MPDSIQPEMRDNVSGTIYHMGSDFCFIESPDIPRTRIYMHWTGLAPNTLHFDKLVKGMNVTFRALNNPAKGWRAVKVRVIEDTKPNE